MRIVPDPKIVFRGPSKRLLHRPLHAHRARYFKLRTLCAVWAPKKRGSCVCAKPFLKRWKWRSMLRNEVSDIYLCESFSWGRAMRRKNNWWILQKTFFPSIHSPLFLLSHFQPFSRFINLIRARCNNMRITCFSMRHSSSFCTTIREHLRGPRRSFIQ